MIDFAAFRHRPAARLRAWLDLWIFHSYDPAPHHLGLFRIIYAGFSLVMLFGYRFDWLSDLPSGFFAPRPGIGQLFSDFPSAPVMQALSGLMIVLNVLLLVGWRTRWVSIAFSAVLIVLFALLFSLGNIYHLILWASTPLVMSFSGWGNSLSLDARRAGREGPVNGWALTLMAFVVGFSFFTAGYAKLSGGWLISESAVWQHFMNVYYGVGEGRDKLLAPFFAGFQLPWFWDLSDWYVVWWQLLFVFAALHPTTMRLFCWMGIVFHVMVLLILNISFSIHVIVFLAFTNWARIERVYARAFAAVIHGIRRLVEGLRWWMIAAFLGVYLTAFFLQTDYYLVDGPTGFELLVFAFATVWYLGVVPLAALLERNRLAGAAADAA